MAVDPSCYFGLLGRDLHRLYGGRHGDSHWKSQGRRWQAHRCGRAFLERAHPVLSQVEGASEAARRVAHPAKPCFAMGFLTGHELTWMPEALQILRHELPNIDVMISSQYSPQFADGLSKGKIDAAFLRRERGVAWPCRTRLLYCVWSPTIT